MVYAPSGLSRAEATARVCRIHIDYRPLSSPCEPSSELCGGQTPSHIFSQVTCVLPQWRDGLTVRPWLGVESVTAPVGYRTRGRERWHRRRCVLNASWYRWRELKELSDPDLWPEGVGVVPSHWRHRTVLDGSHRAADGNHRTFKRLGVKTMLRP